MGKGLEVRELREDDFSTWEALVAASPDGSPYSLPGYLDALCAAAGGSFTMLGAWRGEELVGGVALYLTQDGGLRRAAPRLLLYYHSPVLRPYETRYPSQRTSREVECLTALAGSVEQLGLDAVMLKCRHTVQDVRPFVARGWSCRPSWSYIVPLDDLEAQRTRVEQNLRRLIDRCERQGLTVSEDDDFEAFLALHLQALDRKGVAPYLPAQAFRRYWEGTRAAGLARLYHARMPDGRVAASQLVLAGGHPLSHTASAAADPEFLNLGVSAFLRWKAFEQLAALGYTGNDLTDAALNPVSRFKAQLGGDLVLCHVLEAPASPRARIRGHWRGITSGMRGAAGRLLRAAGLRR